MVRATFAFQAINSGIMVLLFAAGLVPESIAFWAYLYWTITVFFMAGLTIGNLNALALQPMGHIAGMAASVIAAISTVLSVILAIPIGQAFNGTPAPLLIGTMICSGLCWLLMTRSNEIDDLSGAPHLHT